MKVVVLGGTRFIGRAIVEELAAAGHDLLIAHRGVLEPEGLPAAQHLHVDRAELPAHRSELVAFEQDAAIDCRALTEFILRRLRAGRKGIPFGAGTWLACRAYVGDIARGARLALDSASTKGMPLNLCEDRTFSMAMWSRMILEAAGSRAELVRVADEMLPEDLKPTGAMTQHIAASARRAREMLGWTTSDPAETLRTTVRWHLEHPPVNADPDFTADDRALETA